MQCKEVNFLNNVIKLVSKDKQVADCNILIRFEYKENEYIVYTDNKCNEFGDYNLYKALIDRDHRIMDPLDESVNSIFDRLIYEYKQKVIKGEI